MKEIVKGDQSIIIVRIKNDKDPILVKIRLKPYKVCNIICTCTTCVCTCTSSNGLLNIHTLTHSMIMITANILLL